MRCIVNPRREDRRDDDAAGRRQRALPAADGIARQCDDAALDLERRVDVARAGRFRNPRAGDTGAVQGNEVLGGDCRVVVRGGHGRRERAGAVKRAFYRSTRRTAYRDEGIAWEHGLHLSRVVTARAGRARIERRFAKCGFPRIDRTSIEWRRGIRCRGFATRERFSTHCTMRAADDPDAAFQSVTGIGIETPMRYSRTISHDRDHAIRNTSASFRELHGH
jgi:hypothetical protein